MGREQGPRGGVRSARGAPEAPPGSRAGPRPVPVQHGAIQRVRPQAARTRSGSVEISKVISEAFASVVFVEQFPRTSVDIFIEVLQADAGTRCAGLTAASVALADAGIPMRDLVASCASGKIGGVVALDLNKDEDNFGEADCPMAIVPRSGEIVLLQMDGHLTADEFDKAMDLSINATKQIYELQRDALRRRYASVAEAAEQDAMREPARSEETPREMPPDLPPEVDDL